MILYILIKVSFLLIVLGLALYQDVRENKIKNAVTFPAALLGLAMNFSESGTGGICFSLQGFFVPILSLMALYLLNVMGAGDIKLFAAIGSIMGLKFAAQSFVLSLYCGGVIAIVILIRKKTLASRLKKVFNYIGLTMSIGKIIPYGTKESRESKFIFSAAIVPGTCLQILITLLQHKGVTVNAGWIAWL